MPIANLKRACAAVKKVEDGINELKKKCAHKEIIYHLSQSHCRADKFRIRFTFSICRVVCPVRMDRLVLLLPIFNKRGNLASVISPRLSLSLWREEITGISPRVVRARDGPFTYPRMNLDTWWSTRWWAGRYSGAGCGSTVHSGSRAPASHRATFRLRSPECGT